MILDMIAGPSAAFSTTIKGKSPAHKNCHPDTLGTTESCTSRSMLPQLHLHVHSCAKIRVPRTVPLRRKVCFGNAALVVALAVLMFGSTHQVLRAHANKNDGSVVGNALMAGGLRCHTMEFKKRLNPFQVALSCVDKKTIASF
jgi:hypothetical protein